MPDHINEVISDPIRRGNLERRFMQKFRAAGPKACWPWTAKARHYFGYGAINAGRGNLYNSHVVAYALANGPIPVGAFVLHSCDNPGCCNPAHLRIGDKDSNTEDMKTRKRLQGKTGPVDSKRCAKKLNPKLAKEIRESKLSRLELAQAYGVSPHTISNIKAGRTYSRCLHARSGP